MALKEMRRHARELRKEHSSFDELLGFAEKVLPLFDPAEWTQVAGPGGKQYYVNKKARPLNSRLFVSDPIEFRSLSSQCRSAFELIRSGRAGEIPRDDFRASVSRLVYTVQQCVGVVLDQGAKQRARKRAGMIFETLVRLLLEEVGMAVKKITFELKSSIGEVEVPFKCELDWVVSKSGTVLSSSNHIEPGERILAIETTSKDRLAKVFLEKKLLEEFARFMGLKNGPRVSAIVLHDVQLKTNKRRGVLGISETFVPDRFIVYSHHLARLDGVFYVDPPTHIERSPWNQHLFPISEFLLGAG